MGVIRNSLFAEASAILLLRLFTYLSLFASTIVVSRALGPDARGAYFLVLVTAMTLAVITQFGLAQANVYLLATRNKSIEVLAQQNASAAVLSAVVSAALIPLVALTTPGIFTDVAVSHLFLGAATVPFIVHTQLTAGLQLLEQRVTWAFVAALFGGATHLAILGGLAAITALDVTTALLANLLAVIVTWLLTIARGNPATRCLPRPNMGLIRETVRHSLLIHTGTILIMLHFRADVFLVKGISGSAALGIYSLSVVLAETVIQATDGLSIALLPRQLKNTFAEAAEQVVRMARLNVLTGLFVAVAWTAAGWLLIPGLFGVDFSGAYLPLLLLLPGMIAFGVQRLSGPLILRAARADLLVKFNAAALSMNIALSLVLIPPFGPIGAAVATSLSYVTSAALYMAWTMGLAPGTHAFDLVPRRSDIALVTRLPRRFVIEFARRHS